MKMNQIAQAAIGVALGMVLYDALRKHTPIAQVTG